MLLLSALIPEGQPRTVCGQHEQSVDLWAGMSKHEHRSPLAVQGRLKGKEREGMGQGCTTMHLCLA